MQHGDRDEWKYSTSSLCGAALFSSLKLAISKSKAQLPFRQQRTLNPARQKPSLYIEPLLREGGKIQGVEKELGERRKAILFSGPVPRKKFTATDEKKI